MSPARPFPAVPLELLSRLEDNLYIVCMHLPEGLRVIVREALSVLLHLVYGICLKWEAHVAMASWGKGCIGVDSHGSVCLLQKACAVSLHGDL